MVRLKSVADQHRLALFVNRGLIDKHLLFKQRESRSVSASHSFSLGMKSSSFGLGGILISNFIGVVGVIVVAMRVLMF
jgi:hypothetical protein